MIVPKAAYEIIYNGTNITGNILPYTISFSYTDKSKGEADEIELLLEDSDKLWQNEWYPTKGDKVSAKIFYMGNTLDCGTFVVDEITGSGSAEGDLIAIKGIAAGINKKIRTKLSSAHENKTLREIANTIAAKHGFTVHGKIADVRLGRETQYKETDLQFLNRLANEYGYTFSVRDSKLTFTNIFDIENKENALTILRNEMISWSIGDKTSKTYAAVKISYHNAKQRKVITHTQTEKEKSYQLSKVDTLEIRVRAENEQQAEVKSKVALYRANSLQQEGTIEMPGNILAVAGNNCEIQGIGVFSGKFYLESSTHQVTRDGGYVSSLAVKRVGLIEKKKQKT
jgi:phage protein D